MKQTGGIIQTGPMITGAGTAEWKERQNLNLRKSKETTPHIFSYHMMSLSEFYHIPEKFVNISHIAAKRITGSKDIYDPKERGNNASVNPNIVARSNLNPSIW